MNTRKMKLWIVLSGTALLVSSCALFTPSRPRLVTGATVEAEPPAVAADGAAKSPQAGREPGGTGGFSLRQRDFIRQQEGYFNPEVDTFAEACGYRIEARIDWPSFRDQIDLQLDGQLSRGFASYCAEPLQEMTHMCRTQPGWREALTGRVNGYVCRFGGTGGRAMDLRGGTLTMAVDWEAPNTFQFIRDYLGRAL